METALVTTEPGKLSADAKFFLTSAISEHTKRAYTVDWKDWCDWCADNQVRTNLAQSTDVANFLAYLAKQGMQASTIARRAAAIRKAYQYNQTLDPNATNPFKDDLARDVLRGARRVTGYKAEKKKAILAKDVRKIVAVIPGGLPNARNKALFLVQWITASRISEIVALEYSDLDLDQQNIEIRIGKSKTDQAGKGTTKVIPFTGKPTCPVTALRAWLSESGITSGPVFRGILCDNTTLRDGNLSSRAVQDIVKTLCAEAGLVGDYSTHSNRSGFITQALKDGKTSAQIRSVSKHKTDQQMHEYGQMDISDQLAASGDLL
jgi:site-specific recombinase XerD